MKLPLQPPYPVMEADTWDEIPAGAGWQYEPKWDGFRCLMFRDGPEVELQSKGAKTLTRYFPEVVEAVRALRDRRFVVDGELVVPLEDGLSFDALLQRIHPAETRVRKLAAETPARLILFDVLARNSETLVDRPLSERRRRLEEFADRNLDGAASIHLSPATENIETAHRWFEELSGVDGVLAKRRDAPYRSGERAMVKVKRIRSADCVVGGFRYSSGGKSKGVGSILLGLYDEDGLLHHVGYSSSFATRDRARLARELAPLIEPPGFTGDAPGGPSRWSRGESKEWQPLRPERVVEVEYDHFSNGRFRHGTKFLRWRPDKAPEQCTFDQIPAAGRGALDLIES